jgi:DNA polymerase III delta prime subunit
VSLFSGLTGQERAVEQLTRAIAGGRVPHAYVFSGPSGAPMQDLAIALACALNCPVEPGSGCGHCDACTKILGGFHPDVVTLVREQVIARIALPPHEAEVRVFIVEEATAMAPPAANALLKTLEEPPSRTLFVLCTTAPEQLLPTLRSRCQRVRLAAGSAMPADVARAERVERLAEELASDTPDPSLPSRVAEGKGDAALVVLAAASLLHAEAREAAARADLPAARRAAHRAETVMAWHVPIAIHNANPQLAIEALVVALGQDA